MAKKEIEIPEGINLEAWSEWVAFRKDFKRKPVSVPAANKQFKLLLKYDAIGQQEIIDKSISNDYQGLFDIRQNNMPQSRATVSPMQQLTDTSWADGMLDDVVSTQQFIQ